ncbi:MAG: F0F1 ATP synthase subunit delta [Bacillota bacterium]|nr:F0F1 ATP synthase subunit delta [Bacillota bacterium]
MLFDWFTVIAQIVNFLVLVWLMKRFLYKPVLQAIDQREEGIAAKIAAADTAKLEAEKLSELFKGKNDDFDRQFSERMADAAAEVEAKRQQWLAEAREAAETLAEQRKAHLKKEAQDFEDDFSLQTRETVIAILQKILQDLAGTDFEARIAAVMLERLAMPETAESWQMHLSEDDQNPVTVTSAFPLSSAQKEQFEQAIQAILPAAVQIIFDTDPALICGIEIKFSDLKIAWSVQDYLDNLQKKLTVMVDAA